MSSFPPPLTPSHVDLRGLPWMPLHGDRLFGSDTWLLASDAGRVAALTLWWASWKQSPAGSLPDHDRALAQLAGFGTQVKAWMDIRAEVMRGWVKCSDGRLYHPVVCELALEALELRVEKTEKVDHKKERQRRWRERLKAASKALRERGIAVPKGASLETLERLLGDGFVDADVDGGDATRDVSRDGGEIGKIVHDSTGRKNLKDSLDAARGETVSEAPEKPTVLPSSVTHVVQATTIALKGNAIGQPFKTPPPPRRTPAEQIAVLVPKTIPSKPLTPEQLAEARKQTALADGAHPLQGFARQCRLLAGMEDAAGPSDCRAAQSWLDSGISQGDALERIRAHVARRGYSPPSHLSYFSAIVRTVPAPQLQENQR